MIFEGLSLKQIKNFLEGESPTLTTCFRENFKYLFGNPFTLHCAYINFP